MDSSERYRDASTSLASFSCFRTALTETWVENFNWVWGNGKPLVYLPILAIGNGELLAR